MTDLRNAVESCEADRIELKNQRELNSKLVNTSSPEKAIWQEWWVKLPVGLLIGTLAGSIAGKQLESYVVGGLAGGLAGATSTVILDMKF